MLKPEKFSLKFLDENHKMSRTGKVMKNIGLLFFNKSTDV